MTAALTLNRAKMTTTTTGTGTVTLGEAVAPFLSLATAGAVDQGTYSYCIEDLQTGNWELGWGLYTASGTTLTRNVDINNSGTTSAITLSGASYVTILERAGEKWVPPVTILQKNTGQSVTNATWTTVTWDTTAMQDDVGAFSGSSPTVLTVPAGITRVRVTLHTIWQNTGTNTSAYSQIDCSRSIGPGTQGTLGVDIRYGSNEHGGYNHTPWLGGLVKGDTISVQVLQNSGGTINFSPASGFTQAWLQAEWAS